MLGGKKNLMFCVFYMPMTYSAVVLQRCFQTLQLSWQCVMVLGHQHNAIKTENKSNTILQLSLQMTRIENNSTEYLLLVLEVSGPLSRLDAGHRNRKRNF